MKKFLLFFFALAAFSVVKAAPEFKSGTKYRFSCKKFNSTDGAGSLALGANHGSTAEIYYLTTSTYSDDSWWYITKSGNGYTIVNAQSGQYMTYTTNRVSGKTKGITLTSSNTGDASLWNFNTDSNYDGYCTVANVENPDQWFNLRIDGTYLLGSYEGSGSPHELYKIYDEAGNDLLNQSSGGGTGGGGTGGGGDSGSTTTDDYNNKTMGTNSLGEYWERTNLKQPIVYTTDRTNPVLYTIINLRSGRYVSTGTALNSSANTVLTEVADATARTRFYFYKTSAGVQIYTENGQYVSTDYASANNGRIGVSVASGTLSANFWTIGWGSDTYSENKTTYSGYTLGKVDNLPTTNTSQSSYLYWNDYSLDNNQGSSNVREVGLYNVDSGSLFAFASSDIRHGVYLQDQGLDFGISVTPTSLNDALDSLRLNDKQLVFDQKELCYYYPLPTALREGGDFTPKLTYKLKSQYGTSYVLKVNGSEAGADSTVTFTSPNCTDEYPLELVNNTTGETAFSSKLKFTYLPIVELTYPSCNGSTYTTGSIRITAATTQGYDSTYIAAFKYRGASSSNYPKRSYAVKLRDEFGNSVDRKLLGYRSDNNWILDAMYIDRACMRNRVSTDLWNDYSVKPYYADREKKVRTGTRGEFAEVFVNGSYWGLYCFTEKLDRKQLKLKKFVPAAESTTGSDEEHGMLYKSTDWTYEVLMGHKPNSRRFPYTEATEATNSLGKETWQGFEYKYPDYETEVVNWDPLRNAINFVCTTTSQSTFDSQIDNYFDYPMVRDYYLLINLALATDNHGKNMFFYVYDRQGAEGDKLSLCPWDMDGTFGQNWEADTTYTYDAMQDFDELMWSHEHGQLTLFMNLGMGSHHWYDDLKERYRELRHNYFDPDNLAKRFADYASLFADAGADIREQNKWGKYHKTLQWGAQYIQRWIQSRVKFLDKYYGYDPILEDINDATAQSYFAAKGGDGAIAVNVGTPQLIRIYTASGTLVKSVQVNAGFTPISGFAPGIYIVGGQKVIVK